MATQNETAMALPTEYPTWALELELHLRRGPARFCYACESWLDGQSASPESQCPECKQAGFIVDGTAQPGHASSAYLAWRARAVAKHLPAPTNVDKLCALLKEAGAEIRIGLEQQGHVETVRKMLAAGKSWEEINEAIGWSGTAAREEWEAMGYGWRMDAYYYGLERTGVPAVDLVLSAVACAGKRAHHTDGWTDAVDNAWHEPYHEGATPVEWIQNAANKAAAEYRELLARPRR